MDNTDIREERILSILFKGMIPVERRHEIPAFERAIKALVYQADNSEAEKLWRKQRRNITHPTGPCSPESAKITEQIVDLRKSGMTWPAIAEILQERGYTCRGGAPITVDAVRNRYAAWRTGRCMEGTEDEIDALDSPNVLLTKPTEEDLSEHEANLFHVRATPPIDEEAEPRHFISVTPVLNSPFYRAIREGVAAKIDINEAKYDLDSWSLLPSCPTGRAEERPAETPEQPPIVEQTPDPAPSVNVPPEPEQKDPIAIIYRMKDESPNMTVKEISAELAKMDIDIPWQRVRAVLGIRAREAHKELVKIEARKKAFKPKPEPVIKFPEPSKEKPPDFDKVVDTKIINMKKRGLMDIEIAQALELNPGGRWTGPKVAERYKELQVEAGAEGLA